MIFWGNVGLTPIISLSLLNCSVGKAFVKISATWSSDLKYITLTLFFSWSCLIYKCFISMCFVALKFTGFCIILIAAWLSQCIVMGFFCVKPISPRRCHKNSLSFTPSFTAFNSASAVDIVMLSWLLLLAPMQPPAINDINPVMDFLCSSFEAKLASVYRVGCM